MKATLVLRDAWARDGGADVDVRLRRLLKAALRSYGLRCVSVTGSFRRNGRATERTPDGGTQGMGKSS